MRSFPSLSRSVLVAAAATVLLTGCTSGSSGDGSDSEESAESTSADTSSSAAPSTGSSSAGSSSAGSSDPAVAAFCQQGEQFDSLVTGLQTAAPEQVPGILQQAVGAFDAAAPPAEIATDWQVIGDALRNLSGTADTLDLTSPEGQQQFTQAANDTLGQAGDAVTNVETFTQANCGGAAPTS